MNILLTGASGFIGRYLLASLAQAGHHVVPAVRRPAEADRLLAEPASIAVDLNRDTRVEDWLPRLAGIDAVINCAGVLQGRPGQSMRAVHTTAPTALFAACLRAGVKRVIQISAISAEQAAGTAYALTKRAADEFLAATDLDWIVLRPSLVYAQGAYGGTALLRALAALPLVIPVIGHGEQLFQPIHVDDLSATVTSLLDRPRIRGVVIDPVGPDTLTLRRILVDLRRWLGLPPARVIEVPLPLVRILARIGDVVGGPVNTTSLRQLVYGNAGRLEPFVAAVGVKPRPWSTALLAQPAQAQDRWHARIYFLRPVLRWALALTWIASGTVGLLQPKAVTAPVLAALGLSGIAAFLAIPAACLLDIAIGAALLARWRPRSLAAAQLSVVAGYTVGLTYAEPALWTDPFGPLLKNLPLAIAIMISAVLEPDR